MTVISNLREIVSDIIKPEKKIAIGGGAMFLKPMEYFNSVDNLKEVTSKSLDNILDATVFNLNNYVYLKVIENENISRNKRKTIAFL